MISEHIDSKIDSLIAGVSGVFFFLSCIFVMGNGHLYEDAYILFQYSFNLSQGLGIVFDVANGPAEGATDFLWMFVLGISHHISKGQIPIGIIAALFNSLGLAYITKQILEIRQSIDLTAIALCILLMVSGGAAAALGGFSTVAYGAVYVATVLAFHRKKLTRGLLLATFLALFRPDGFFLGSATIVAFLAIDWHELDLKTASKKIILFYLAPLLVYFAWRYSYFGLLLPLPLLVKQKTDSAFEGLWANIKSLRWYILIIPAIFLYSRTSIQEENNRRLLILSFSGSLTLFILLFFVHQSQNLGYRFQFPLHLSIILIASSIFPRAGRFKFASSALVIVTIIYLFKSYHAKMKYLTNNDYINSLPQILSRRFDLNSIAVTEAGRFPYWYNCSSMIDLVGLNSKNVVLKGPTSELKKKLPDLIFIHHAERYIYPESLVNSGQDFFEFDPNSIELSPYEGANPVKLAPEAALSDAIDRSLTGIAVKYGKRDISYSHVYFVSASIDLHAFKTAIADSVSTKINYFSSEHFKSNK